MSHKKTVAKSNKQAPVGSNATNTVPPINNSNNAFTPGMLAALGLGVALFVVATLKWSGSNNVGNNTKQVPSYSTTATSTIEVTNNVSANKNRQPNSTKTLNEMEGLSSARSVFLRGPIFATTAKDVIAQINSLSDSASPIYLFIDSPGGSVFEGEKIISAMESAKGPVNTVCIGLCASMAAYIHQYGAQRYAYDRAILMFHDGSGGVQGEVEKMNSMLSFVRRKIEKIDNHIAARSGLPIEVFVSLKLSDLWIDAEDAQTKGLVDKLVKVAKLDSPQDFNDFEDKVPGVKKDGAEKSLFPFELIYTPNHQ